MENVQFSIAVHLMAALAANPGRAITSAELAQSVNTSPSFVRRIVSKLSRAGLIRTTTGKTGACMLIKNVRSITLLEIYRAVEPPKVFAIHAYPETRCAVSCGIKGALGKVRDTAQHSMEAGLKKVALSDVMANLI